MTAQEMKEIASSEGFEMDFQFFGTSDKEIGDLDDEGNYTKEYVDFTEYQGYGDGLEYGIFARISDEPEKAANEFFVVFAEGAQDTNGTAYDTLENALRYMGYIIKR